MGEIVNLRQARKGKARDEAGRAAQENRAKFGQTKSHKAQREQEKKRADTALEGHKRDTRDRSSDPC